MSIIINPEFKELLPALTSVQRKELEDSLKKRGCRDSLVLWGKILIDGHNRHDICEKNGIKYETTQIEFSSEDDAKLWIISNQVGRRSLNRFQRCAVALKKKTILAKKANENQGRRNDLTQNSAESGSEFTPVSTREELAKFADVSHDTISKVEKILEDAIPELKEMAEAEKLSIHAAHRISSLKTEEQIAVVKKIKDNMPVHKAIAAVKPPKKNQETLIGEKSEPISEEPVNIEDETNVSPTEGIQTTETDNDEDNWEVKESFYVTSDSKNGYGVKNNACFNAEKLKGGDLRITLPGDDGSFKVEKMRSGELRITISCNYAMKHLMQLFDESKASDSLKQEKESSSMGKSESLPENSGYEVW